MKSMRMALITGVVASLMAFGAHAAPITVSYAGYTNGSAEGSIAGARTANVLAGQFSFNVVDDGGVYWDDTLSAFCIDVTTNLITSGAAQYELAAASASPRLTSQQVTQISALYGQRGDQITNASTSAAFQLALWEIIYDPTVLNLLTGSLSTDFRATTAFGSARTLAQSWLNTLNLSYAGLYELHVLTPVGSQPNQALITARPASVPDPGTLALLGAGLFGVGLSRRRRNS